MTSKEFKRLLPGNLLVFSRRAQSSIEHFRFMAWAVSFGNFSVVPDPGTVMLVTDTGKTAKQASQGTKVEFNSSVTVHFVNQNGQTGEGTIYHHENKSIESLELVRE